MDDSERKRVLLQRAHDAIEFALTNPGNDDLEQWLVDSGLEPFDDDWRMSEDRLLRWAGANLSAAIRIVKSQK